MISSKVEDVICIQKRKTERSEKVKQEIINIINNKIKNYANLGILEFIYKIPNFIFGYPPYNITLVTKCIYKQLKSDGFYVVKMNDEYLYISWDINKLHKKDKHEPINLSAFVNSNKTK